MLKTLTQEIEETHFKAHCFIRDIRSQEISGLITELASDGSIVAEKFYGTIGACYYFKKESDRDSFIILVNEQ